MRRGEVKYNGITAGYIEQNSDGYKFFYDESYLSLVKSKPISKTLPLSKEIYRSNVLFPFFDGIIPEGWLLSIVEKNWKINPRDRMGLLLSCCQDCIGAVSVFEIVNEE